MIESATHVRIVLSTAGSREEAESIARGLIDERLAACVNLVPGLVSVYRWLGEVESSDEVLLVIKTTATSVEAVEGALRRLHSYEVPEMLVLTPEAGSHAYLEWLVHSVGSASEGPERH
jgi:periplasmic divalent cation tolerance protein